MDTRKEKELDDFIRHAVQDAGLEEPAPGLKANIMDALKTRYSPVTYTALISKKTWFIVAICLMFFVGVAWYNPLEIHSYGKDLIPWDISIIMGQVSQITLYGVGIFGLMILLQVFLLKRKMDQDYQ